MVAFKLLKGDLMAGNHWKWVLTCSIWAGLLMHPHAWAHGTKHGTHDAAGPYPVVQQVFGIAGNPKTLTRTIILDMEDTMRFSPSDINVKQGDTIRFVLRNNGKILHEWVLGTEPELKQHAEMMRKMPDMKHDEVHMVHVAPGETEAVVWHFNRPGIFKFACLMPGHFEAGMSGTVIVKAVRN
jgi:uncharacterized cupredoxin-like copper-binding protein